MCATYRKQIFNLNCIIKSKIEKSESETEKSLVEESEEITVTHISQVKEKRLFYKRFPGKCRDQSS